MDKKKLSVDLKSGVWLSAAVCFMLCLYAPLELLFTNQDEFWFDAYLLTPIMFVAFAVLCAVSILVLALLHRAGAGLYEIVLWLYFSAYLCLYVQGNLLTEGLPPLDGETIDWSRYTAERARSVILWVSVPAVMLAVKFWCRKKRELLNRIVETVSICMTLMLCVTLLTLAIQNDGFARKPNLCVTARNMFQMSRDANFVILVLDAVDAQAMEEMLQETPEYQDIFTDFTFYDNVVGAYPYTKYCVPYILTGQWYENERAFAEYEAEAYAESPLLAELEQSGYGMGLYEDAYEAELLLNDNGMGRFENVLSNERGVTDSWAFARWQLLMTGFKYAPFDLKRFSFVNPNAFSGLKILPEGERLFTYSNTEFYDGVLHDEISYTDQRCFRFIHIDGGHVPFIYNENVEIIPEETGTYEDSLKACLTITRAYLQKLKDAGVYDNSAIIVMADHGYAYGDIHARQNPIFFVKGVGERHDYTVSDAPISFEDLQEAYRRLLQGADGGSIFDWHSGDERERRFLFHEYLKEDYMVEYIQTGRAHDSATMRATGKIYER